MNCAHGRPNSAYCPHCPEPPARVLDFKTRGTHEPPAPVVVIPRCVCDHTQNAHVAWSGACRPGFACLAHCQIFRARGRA